MIEEAPGNKIKNESWDGSWDNERIAELIGRWGDSLMSPDDVCKELSVTQNSAPIFKEKLLDVQSVYGKAYLLNFFGKYGTKDTAYDRLRMRLFGV
jgi:hypothetical protein